MQLAQQTLQSFSKMFLVRGIIALLFGVLALVMSPGITLTFLVYLFGAYAVIAGVTAATTALRYSSTEGWALLLVQGILSIIAGVVAFVWPGITAFAFLFLIAAWAIVTGVTEVIAAFALPIGAKREWLLGIAGVLSIIFGVLITMQPRAGLVTIVWLTGIYAVVYGVTYIVRFFQARSIASSLS